MYWFLLRSWPDASILTNDKARGLKEGNLAAALGHGPLRSSQLILLIRSVPLFPLISTTAQSSRPGGGDVIAKTGLLPVFFPGCTI